MNLPDMNVQVQGIIDYITAKIFLMCIYLFSLDVQLYFNIYVL